MMLSYQDNKINFRNAIDTINSKLKYFTKQLFAIMNGNYLNKICENIPKATTFFANCASLHLDEYTKRFASLLCLLIETLEQCKISTDFKYLHTC